MLPLDVASSTWLHVASDQYPIQQEPAKAFWVDTGTKSSDAMLTCLVEWISIVRWFPNPYPHFLVTWLANLASCEACCDLVMYSKRTGWHRKLSCKERQLRVLNFCKQRKRNTTNYVCGCVTGLGDLWRSRKLIIFFNFVLLFERKKIFEKLWGLNNDFHRELYCWDRWRCLKF